MNNRSNGSTLDYAYKSLALFYCSISRAFSSNLYVHKSPVHTEQYPHTHSSRSSAHGTTVKQLHYFVWNKRFGNENKMQGENIRSCGERDHWAQKTLRMLVKMAAQPLVLDVFLITGSFLLFSRCRFKSIGQRKLKCLPKIRKLRITDNIRYISGSIQSGSRVLK